LRAAPGNVAPRHLRTGVSGWSVCLADHQRELAKEETRRADQFVNLVSSNPAGRRAMKKICLEAIEVTAMLATTPDQQQNMRAEERFWELYYAQMYIIELHQAKNTGRTARELNSGVGMKSRCSLRRGGTITDSLSPMVADGWAWNHHDLQVPAPLVNIAHFQKLMN
jgi:hypothetical protein